MRRLLVLLLALTACSVDSDDGGEDEDGGQVSGTPVQPEPEHRTCDEIVECLLKEPVTCAGLDEEPSLEDAEYAVEFCTEERGRDSPMFDDCTAFYCE